MDQNAQTPTGQTITQKIFAALKRVPHYLLLLWRVPTIRTYVIAIIIGILKRSGVNLPFEVVSSVINMVLGDGATDGATDASMVAVGAVGLPLALGTAMANDKMSDLKARLQAINDKYKDSFA